MCATLRDDVAGTEERQPYAAVICATGYQCAAAGSGSRR
jgi:L-ornithine N5-oxygenase